MFLQGSQILHERNLGAADRTLHAAVRRGIGPGLCRMLHTDFWEHLLLGSLVSNPLVANRYTNSTLTSGSSPPVAEKWNFGASSVRTV
jgi:hypothetical protein